MRQQQKICEAATKFQCQTIQITVTKSLQIIYTFNTDYERGIGPCTGLQIQ